MAPGNQRASLSQTTHESADSGRKPKVKRRAETLRGTEATEDTKHRSTVRLSRLGHLALSACQTDRSSIRTCIH